MKIKHSTLSIFLITLCTLLFQSCNSIPTGTGPVDSEFAFISTAKLLGNTSNGSDVSVSHIDGKPVKFRSFQSGYQVLGGPRKLVCTIPKVGNIGVSGQLTFTEDFQKGHTYEISAYRQGTNYIWVLKNITNLPTVTLFTKTTTRLN